MLFSPQMPLPLEPRKAGGFDDFVAGPNGAVVAAVRETVVNSDSSLLIAGPPGSGKSHLLNAACLAARQEGRTAFYLGLRGVSDEAAEGLRGLESMDIVCLDDLQSVIGRPVWEEALFHFINRLREQQGSLLVASRERLRQLPFGLPDLASRLAWGLRLTLQPLEDADKARVLVRHGQGLGIELPEEVTQYLLSRGPRDMATLVGLVTRMQQVAFQEKRQLTVPLARQLMKG